MADKIFYVTRTENEQTHTAGTAALHRADKPQLIKVYDNPTDIDVSALSEGEVVGTKGADFNCVAIVDRVAVDNMNPVTSNAVADALSYSTEETLTGGRWIDGKPIYRKVLDGLTWPSGEWSQASNSKFAALNIDTVTYALFFTVTRKVAATVQLDYNLESAGKWSLRGDATGASGIGKCIIEYTKTEIPTRESETKKSGDNKSEEVKSEDEKPVESDDGNHGVYIVPKENTPNPYSGAYTSNGGEIIQGR